MEEQLDVGSTPTTSTRQQKGRDFMEYIKDFIYKLPQTKIIHSIIVIIVSFLIYKIIMKFFMKSEKNSNISKRLNNKSRTYLRLTRSIFRYIFIILTVLIILQINGVDVSSLLAGVGILSVIIGLAVQDALKDIIRGFSILSEEYYSVGDVITYKENTGKVISLGLKTTKIEDIKTGNIISIANRNIEQVEVNSNYLYLNFPMPYEIPVDKAEKVAISIAEHIKEIDDVEDASYIGVTELADSSIKYLLKITCNPERRLQVRRDSYGIILRILDKNKINVPYTQIDIHQK